MSLPGVVVNQIDGTLGISSGSPSQTAVIVGACTSGTPATLYSVGSSTQALASLGAGKLCEDACYILDVAGGPQYFMPVNPSIAGAIQSPAHTGTGSGTLALSSASHVAITFTITTGGALNTAKATIQLGGGAISQPVLLPTGGVLPVPGTYATGTFSAGTYVVGDTYVVSTAGVVTHTGTGTPTTPTFTASPLDDYQLIISMTAGGANGTAAFTYSLDSGNDTSASIITPGTGIYAIPNSGIVLTFTGTQAAGDYWTAQAAAPSWSGSDIAACTTALETTYLGTASYSLLYVDRYATTAAAAVTEASALQTYALAMKAQGVYVRAIGAAPTVGSINIVSNAVSIDSADTDSVIETAFQSVVAEHAAMAAGDCLIALPNSGLSLRRNAGLVAIARALQFEASANIGAVGNGGVTVAGIYRDENATPGLDAARLITLRTFPNYPGIYLTDGHTLAQSTSAYAALTNARVVDRACTISRTQAMPLVLGKVITSTNPATPGVVSALAAGKINGRMTSALNTSLVDTSPQDAVAAEASVDPTHDILEDGNVIIIVVVEPFAYGKTITISISLQSTV